jgi:hypothetical protein
MRYDKSWIFEADAKKSELLSMIQELPPFRFRPFWSLFESLVAQN